MNWRVSSQQPAVAGWDGALWSQGPGPCTRQSVWEQAGVAHSAPGAGTGRDHRPSGGRGRSALRADGGEWIIALILNLLTACRRLHPACTTCTSSSTSGLARTHRACLHPGTGPQPQPIHRRLLGHMRKKCHRGGGSVFLEGSRPKGEAELTPPPAATGSRLSPDILAHQSSYEVGRSAPLLLQGTRWNLSGLSEILVSRGAYDATAMLDPRIDRCAANNGDQLRLVAQKGHKYPPLSGDGTFGWCRVPRVGLWAVYLTVGTRWSYGGTPAKGTSACQPGGPKR